MSYSNRSSLPPVAVIFIVFAKPPVYLMPCNATLIELI